MEFLVFTLGLGWHFERMKNSKSSLVRKIVLDYP